MTACFYLYICLLQERDDTYLRLKYTTTLQWRPDWRHCHRYNQ